MGDDRPAPSLTDREWEVFRKWEVLRKANAGLTNAEIGADLQMSAETVHNHLDSIARKLGGFASFARPPVGDDRPVPNLTAREWEVLRKMVAGLTNAEIGADLQTSAQTVHSHVRAIVRQLGARDRTYVAWMAIKYGWFDADGEGPDSTGLPVRPRGPDRGPPPPLTRSRPIVR